MDSYSNYTRQAHLNLTKQKLERILTDSNIALPQESGLSIALKQVGSALVNFFAGSHQPQISTVVRNGQTLWKAYDPVTQESTHFSSEAEVLAWLEQRYYQ